MLLLGMLAASGLGYFRIGPVNLGQVAAVIMTAAYAGANGALYGVVGGLLSGLALALGGHDSRAAIALALCGLVCGLPLTVRRRWLCVPAGLCMGWLAFFVTQASFWPLSFWAVGIGTLTYAKRYSAIGKGAAAMRRQGA